MKELVRKPFASAVIGGLVVGIFGWIAIAAGWISSDSDSGSSRPLAPQRALAPTRNASDPKDGLTVEQIYDRTRRGVVHVDAKVTQRSAGPFDLLPQESQGRSTGSGVVLDNQGRILTNAHVVEGQQGITVRFGHGDGERSVDAKLLGQDRSSDLALLQIKDKRSELKPLELGSSRDLRVGDPVVAIGNPFGLDNTVTSGIVSALQRQIQAPNGFSIDNVIQTDASINPGNSGGPLIDGQGHVIGINSQIATTGGGSVGIGFAIPVNTAKRVIADLKANGKVSRAFLGITGVGITPDMVDAFNLPVSEGVLVQSVVKDGPADKAGLREGTTHVTLDGNDLTLGGDIITAVSGRPVRGMDDVVRAVDTRKPGQTIKLEIRRGGKTRTFSAKLDNRPNRVSG